MAYLKEIDAIEEIKEIRGYFQTPCISDMVSSMKRTYERLVAWQEAHKLCLWVYQATQKFPPEEKYGLISQMRCAAYSVPMNLAEGNARRFKKDKARFFEIALASLEELHYQCRLALDLHYLNESQFINVHDHINRTNYLITKLRSAFLS